MYNVHEKIALSAWWLIDDGPLNFKVECDVHVSEDHQGIIEHQKLLFSFQVLFILRLTDFANQFNTNITETFSFSNVVIIKLKKASLCSASKTLRHNFIS